jgi:hypothetical protein
VVHQGGGGAGPPPTLRGKPGASGKVRYLDKVVEVTVPANGQIQPSFT